MNEGKKYGIERFFSLGDKPLETLKYDTGDVPIVDDNNRVIFVQRNVEAPSFWSETAKQIVASRYFYGENETPQRESSVKKLVERVCGTIAGWGISQGYFSQEDAENFYDELAYLSVNQFLAWNSPVWFNVGVDRYIQNSGGRHDIKTAFIYDSNSRTIILLPEGMEYRKPQTSACFIQSVEDTMESIMQLAYNEAMLFKYGSGTGTDLSTLRSSREKLSGGGKPSGPLAYETFYDRTAAIVKSGGKTRRAAKMNSLRVDHPDILEFIEAKAKEQKKLEILMDYGNLDPDPKKAFKIAESTVAFQNANFSIRVSDDFMKAVESDSEWQTVPVHNKELVNQMPKYKARFLLRKIAEGTHACGDPGIQYDDNINKWHTCINSARIKASNPCSEYMFVDDSSCNLLSHNLMRYVDRNGKFDVEKFSRATKLAAISQDLLYDDSCFPTRKIAENSHRFRPVGQGYANLGAILMFLGLPYDSDEARATAAAITALMTGKVYEASTEMAEKIGPFEEFEKNKEPMLKVISMHREALNGINRTKLPRGLENILEEAEKTWKNVEERGRKYGFRNAQATVLAPTGTIGFMMDCDTTGIEPDIALVKYKTLAEGGVIKIVNKTIRPALERLEYSEDKIEGILKYIEEKETIEGAPGLREDHLSIFDCAYKPKNGRRKIHYLGHLKMMAAVQPFLSGAISKTVSLPSDITIEEIENVYIEAWKMGLKAVALYRDGSKRAQPVRVSEEGGLVAKTSAKALAPTRKKLPTTRESLTHKFAICPNLAGEGAHEGYLTLGFHPDGDMLEMFINMSKEGSTIGGLMDTIGTLASLCYQYGVPPEKLSEKFMGMRFEQRGFVTEGRDDMKVTESVTEYVFGAATRFAREHKERKLLTTGGAIPAKINGKREDSKTEDNEDIEEKEEPGGFCINCGTQMIKKGHCAEICPKCKWRDPKGCGE